MQYSIQLIVLQFLPVYRINRSNINKSYTFFKTFVKKSRLISFTNKDAYYYYIIIIIIIIKVLTPCYSGTTLFFAL